MTNAKKNGKNLLSSFDRIAKDIMDRMDPRTDGTRTIMFADTILTHVRESLLTVAQPQRDVVANKTAALFKMAGTNASLARNIITVVAEKFRLTDSDIEGLTWHFTASSRPSTCNAEGLKKLHEGHKKEAAHILDMTPPESLTHEIARAFLNNG